jgi:cytochrome c553
MKKEFPTPMCLHAPIVTAQTPKDPAHPDTSALMEPIAHGLSESQIRAVAAYLSNLE